MPHAMMRHAPCPMPDSRFSIPDQKFLPIYPGNGMMGINVLGRFQSAETEADSIQPPFVTQDNEKCLLPPNHSNNFASTPSAFWRLTP
jgi:hypothetical protein